MNSISGVMMPCAGVRELRDGLCRCFARSGRRRLACQAREIPRGDFSPPCWRTRRVCRRDNRCPAASLRGRRIPPHHRASKSIRGATRANLPRPAGEIRIAPRTGAIVNAHRFICSMRAGVGFRRRHFDFAHRHANVFVHLALDVNFLLAGSCSLLCGSKEDFGSAIIN